MKDVHTHSNFNFVSAQHLKLDLTLDMNQKRFFGHVDLCIDNHGKRDSLVLDCKHLDIHDVSIGTDDNNLVPGTFSLEHHDAVRGHALTIPISPSTKIVRVSYATTKESEGIDWIDESLTEDKFPMMATQLQAINARTLVPCQDTPAQKITYDAKIKLVSNVVDPRMRVVMAAMEREDLGDRQYRFSMTNPIPTYLIAIAAGVFEEIAISHRVSVIAEPSMVKKGAEEFVDAEKMVQAAEELFGEYGWKRFDIFIMPPSFSYGGMENPTMTFIGPTVVAGDKSLVDVIAHELAHSWSGNWVTNENWDEFWINEGTTMYIERLIISKLYGEKARAMDIVLGQQILRDDFASINKKHGPALTKLKLNLNHNFDPDDAVTHVPYEKGFNFWFALEQAYGQPAVRGFLKDYFDQHAFSTMNSAKLKTLIVAYPAFDGARKIDIDDWFNSEGEPACGLPVVESELVRAVDKAVLALKSGVVSLDRSVGSFDTMQWSYFLRSARSTTAEQAVLLNDTYKLMSKNDEVRSNFLVFAIRSQAMEHYREKIDLYLSRVGRIKYVAPIYEALVDEGMRFVANEMREKHEAGNNHITNGAIKRKLA